MRILFKIKDFNINNKCLFIECNIEDIKDKQFVQLYIGKVKLINIKCENFIEQSDGFSMIYNEKSNNSIRFSYWVRIGDLAKHGHGGELSNNLITFAGEQIVVFPVEVLTMNDKKNSNISNITICFNNIKEFKFNRFPFKEKENKLSIDSPKWINIYDIMKSAYTFGDFNSCKAIYNENTLEILSEDIFLDEDVYGNVIEDLKNLHKYYCELFNSYGMKLTLILFTKSMYDENYILGGCGISTIATTFNYENIRDWQLLCHRMFHAFMDYKLKIRQAHIPPTLWLTEGLATYYEITALNALSDFRKKKLNINIENEFKKLFTRYLYMKLRDVNIYNIIPMNERNIKSSGNIEFLHYNLAPLIVKLIESQYSKSGEDNCIIKEMISVEDNNSFSMENIFYNVLKENINEFANRYLFGNEILPLWFLGKYEEDKEEIIEDLNYYEYILWTWFKLEDKNYIKYEAGKNNLEKIENLANKLEANFANKSLESKVKDFSPTLYNLLKEYALRAKVCGISYESIELREYILGDNENIILWKKFIYDNVEKY